MESDYTAIVKQVLVPIFYTEALLARSVKQMDVTSKREFHKQLLDSILELVKKADNGTLTNHDVRGAIKELTEKTKVSVGQAQKVINVYLKYYCILKDKTNLLRELDCPIDSAIAKRVRKALSYEQKQDLANRLGQKDEPLGLTLLSEIFSQKTRLVHMDWLCPNSPVKTPGMDTSDVKHSTLPPILVQPFDSAHHKPLVSIVLFQTRCQGAS